MPRSANLLAASAALVLAGSIGAAMAEPMDLTRGAASQLSASSGDIMYGRPDYGRPDDGRPDYSRPDYRADMAPANTLGGSYSPDRQFGDRRDHSERHLDRMRAAEGQTAIFREYEDWRNRIEPNWNRYGAQLQRDFSRVSQGELMATQGIRSQVLALIEDRYGLSNDRADERLSQWQARALTASSGRSW